MRKKRIERDPATTFSREEFQQMYSALCESLPDRPFAAWLEARNNPEAEKDTPPDIWLPYHY